MHIYDTSAENISLSIQDLKNTHANKKKGGYSLSIPQVPVS
jgi:hypothetical protein